MKTNDVNSIEEHVNILVLLWLTIENLSINFGY